MRREESKAVVWAKKQFVELFEPPNSLRLESGAELVRLPVAYETFGTYNPQKPNAVLVCHALTGDSHACGRYGPDDSKPGWWDPVIGPGRAIDTERYFVICSNVIGGCQGTVGPSSPDPATGRPYGIRFPVVTPRDMVRVQRELMRKLNIPKLLAVIGGSLGGMQVMEWIVTYPDMMTGAIPVATCGRFHPQGIAFNEVQRRAIINDPNWNGGDYYDGLRPEAGLALARMLGMITYRSDESMHRQFSRRVRGTDEDILRGFDTRFEAESYLYHQGDALVRRFDANSYLYLSRAMDLHDVSRGHSSYWEALDRIQAKLLVIGIRSDLLFPTYQQKEIVDICEELGKDVSYYEMDSPWGHDAFLVDHQMIDGVIRGFLAGLTAS